MVGLVQDLNQIEDYEQFFNDCIAKLTPIAQSRECEIEPCGLYKPHGVFYLEIYDNRLGETSAEIFVYFKSPEGEDIITTVTRYFPGGRGHSALIEEDEFDINSNTSLKRTIRKARKLV